MGILVLPSLSLSLGFRWLKSSVLVSQLALVACYSFSPVFPKVLEIAYHFLVQMCNLEGQTQFECV